ncbi:EF-P 5-aminopentanol modification-associated protein YfmH [Levilactobacillus bambusae]|uniref:Insulinase family protein n=1 Tax=Levilactobacillus bambusae TaxID=2024736 RepID=A0A2V1MWX1_9LACO|nr:pitrilysin family protein [Levilactobacillus bambusae]PWF99570.1 insulinase family protein [Levilactobacillus bambusae]
MTNVQKQVYERFGESMISAQLDNGLDVHILPKAGFHKTYAIMTTNYGAIDNTFVPRGERETVHMPDGIAHFLEHKLFEKQDYDAFQLFGQYGASSNAFTTFTTTSYLFSASQNIHDNLDILLDFVQEPYFSEASVNKEKGIIGQEIQMYDDDAGWQLYFGTLRNLFPGEPMSIDIAGTVESIDQITADDLYRSYRTFYHPSNMSLFIVGGIDADETLNWVTANQNRKTFSAPTEIKRHPIHHVKADEVIPFTQTPMPVNRAKAAVGMRGFDSLPEGKAGMVYELALSMMMDLLFNDTSETYLALYNQGLIDDSFGYSSEVERGAHFIMISSETDEPETFIKTFESLLDAAPDKIGQLADQFELVKNEAAGRLISAMNSVEAIANQYSGPLFGQTNIFDELEAVQQLTLADVQRVTTDFIRNGAMTGHVVNPLVDNDKN